VARVLAGGLPFAIALCLYNAACFGGSFELSSAHEKYAGFQSLAKGGVFGIHGPSWDALAGLFLSPSRGLFVLAPVLLLCFRAFDVSARSLARDAAFALAVVPLSCIVLYAGYPNWHGGWGGGPRYLVAAIPFLVFPLVFRRGGRLEAVLAGASVAAVALCALVFPFPPLEFPFPWASFELPLLMDGLVAPNAGHIVARAAGIALPFLVVLAALVAAFPQPSRLAFAATGASASILIGIVAAALGTRPLALAVPRAYVKDVYFGREGELAKTLGPLALPPPLVTRRQTELEHGPAPWPFDGTRR
jgi:hypothetical protein